MFTIISFLACMYRVSGILLSQDWFFLLIFFGKGGEGEGVGFALLFLGRVRMRLCIIDGP